MSISTNFGKTIYKEPNYIFFLEILEYIIFIIILYKYNPFSIPDKYANILTLLAALIYVLLFFFLRENIKLGLVEGQGEPGFLKKALSTLGIFLLSVLVIKFIVSFIANGNLLGLFKIGLALLIIIGALALAYMFFKPLFQKAQQAPKGSVMAFFFKFVLYLPCLLIAFVDYIKNEYHITTKPVWLLLLVEVILIVLWVIIPLILTRYATRNGIQLVKEPQFLAKESILGTFEELYGKDNTIDLNTADNSVERFSYHYSLSAWFYLNPQPPNTSPAYNKYTNILSYGDKPAVEFNGAKNSLRVMVESEKEPGVTQRYMIYETKDILFQKWNNIVINYDRGTMDVFINGVLVGSKPGIAPYMTFESIKVGSSNGLNGGISNVMYYKDNLTRGYIETMYQALKGKDEPFL
jgi:hypothetical protein